MPTVNIPYGHTHLSADIPAENFLGCYTSNLPAAAADPAAEVCRALRPGGHFLICNESDGTDETSLKFEKIIDGMKCYTAKQLENALKAAGFTEVSADHHPKNPWITVIAKK